MALNIATTYPGRHTPPTPAYPHGSGQNETAPGAFDGTPYDVPIGNELIGIVQSALDFGGGVVPNDTPESVTNPQVINAIRAGFKTLLEPLFKASRPAGTIQIDPGTGIAGGGLYLLCNGAEVDRVVYAELFAEIGVKYGDGDGVNTFNLPDYRGYFLRSTDAAAGIDPNAGARTNRGDGTTGDNVGTVQQDELKSHSHFINFESFAPFGFGNGSTGFDSGQTGDTGGDETRPKNINVDLYIFTGYQALIDAIG